MFRGAHKVAARDAATKMYGAITWGRSNQIPSFGILFLGVVQVHVRVAHGMGVSVLYITHKESPKKKTLHTFSILLG